MINAVRRVARRRSVRRASFVAVGGVAVLAAIIVAEILVARRTERLEPWPRAELEGTFGEGDAEPLHLVWIGDSTGSGVGATSPAHALPRVVARGLDRPVRLSVLAESGARTADALAEQLPALEALRPDWVVVAIGNNDVVHVTPRGRFESALTRLLDGIARTGARRVAVLGIAEFAATPLFAQPLRAVAGWRADTLDAVVEDVARRHGALYVDIIEATGPAFVADPARLHARDRFHPSNDGYALWAAATLAAIERAGW